MLLKLSAADAVIVLNGIKELVQPKKYESKCFPMNGIWTRNAQDCGILFAVKDTSVLHSDAVIVLSDIRWIAHPKMFSKLYGPLTGLLDNIGSGLSRHLIRQDGRQTRIRMFCYVCILLLRSLLTDWKEVRLYFKVQYSPLKNHWLWLLSGYK